MLKRKELILRKFEKPFDMSGSMYYLALLIVECILMEATIDYGILFTNYYRECSEK